MSEEGTGNGEMSTASERWATMNGRFWIALPLVLVSLCGLAARPRSAHSTEELTSTVSDQRFDIPSAPAEPKSITAQESRLGPPFAPPESGTRLIYRGAKLIDGTGGPVQDDKAIVTNGSRIEAIHTESTLPPNLIGGAEIIDLKGGYLLPGLIDAHQHLATPPNARVTRARMRRDLYGGITAVRIMGDDLRSIAEIAREAAAGEIEGPDLIYAALLAGPAFYSDQRAIMDSKGMPVGSAPWMQEITSTTDLPLAIAMARGTGATGIKLYTDLSADLIMRLSAEAHRQGMQVWAHAMVFPASPAQTIAAGPDTISHVCMLGYEISDPPLLSYTDKRPLDEKMLDGGRHPIMTQLFASMKDRGVVLDATLRVYSEAERRSTDDSNSKPPRCTAKFAQQLTHQAYRKGVMIVAGTDSHTKPDDPYSALQEELELLASAAQIPTAQVIRIATLNGARALGRERDMGSIEPGKLANFLVLDKNPLETMSNLRSVRFTVKHGRRYSRADYRPIGADEIERQQP